MQTRDKNPNLTYSLDGNYLEIAGMLTIAYVPDFLAYCMKKLPDYKDTFITIRLERVDQMDSSGVTALKYIKKKLESRDIRVEFMGMTSEMEKMIDLFTIRDVEASGQSDELIRSPGFLEKLGKKSITLFKKYITSFFQLAADITYWSAVGLFSKRSYRKGEVTNQAVLMGVNAALIVGLMALIIGLVLALQSAAQLRSFGANIYIVDLTVIAMMTEMGPLITAIMVAGRSGSSIAAEIATMKVTSETDALKTMGLSPVRFIVVPKLYGGLITMPFLTIIANILGIIGGMLIALSFLDISPVVFLNRVENVLVLKDIVFGIIKSFVFIYLIVISGSYFGFSASKVDSGVGRVTTSAVVFSISMVLFADSIMGLLFY